VLIIELSGCTSAGKSTLYQYIRTSLPVSEIQIFRRKVLLYKDDNTFYFFNLFLGVGGIVFGLIYSCILRVLITALWLLREIDNFTFASNVLNLFEAFACFVWSISLSVMYNSLCICDEGLFHISSNILVDHNQVAKRLASKCIILNLRTLSLINCFSKSPMIPFTVLILKREDKYSHLRSILNREDSPFTRSLNEWQDLITNNSFVIDRLAKSKLRYLRIGNQNYARSLILKVFTN
jgi:hypothetical protein